MIAERFTDKMPPRIERDDLARVRPLRVRPHAVGRRGVGEVRDVIRGERTGGDRERTIDRIAAGMRANGVAVIGVMDGRNDRSALGGGWRTPADRRALGAHDDRRARRRRNAPVEHRIQT